MYTNIQFISQNLILEQIKQILIKPIMNTICKHM